jgi:hypothetical protein
MLRPIFLAARLFTGVAREKNLSAMRCLRAWSFAPSRLFRPSRGPTSASPRVSSVINYPPRRPPAWGARIFAAMHVLAFRVLRFWLLLNSAR